ncbi:MAR-binding filament-like protein 1-1 isoform X1 [Typha angustifolia]|uniref:MAR-binding filament-like protein 1-1 isoform X1 n=2 Tax=Typha angustifolia TaxID=59011 RepID=UPI003C2F1340
MGFSMGCSSFLQSPVSIPFSPNGSSSPLLLWPHRKASKKKVFAMGSSGSGNGNLGGPSQRRAFLLVGISVLPLLQLKAVALEDLVQDKEVQGLKQPDQEISLEEPNKSEQDVPGGSFLSVLNALGIVGSGVLGALYATSQKEKAAMESSIASMETALTEKEATISLLKENYERSLSSEQEEQMKQARKFKEEEAILLNQLSSMKRTLTALREELQSEKKLVEELKSEISQLKGSITQAGEEKRMLEAKLKEKMDTADVLQDKVCLLGLEISDKEKNINELKLSLAGKEEDYRSLRSILDQTRDDFESANSTIEQLKEEVLRTREELNNKIFSIDSLNEELQSLHAAKIVAEKKVQDLMKEYDDLKSSSETRANLDSELLLNKDGQLHQLGEKLALALSEATTDRAMIAELKKEKDDAENKLEREVAIVKKLKDELKSTEKSLGASRLEVANLFKELDETKRSYEELMSKVSNIQDEFIEEKRLLTNNLDEAMATKIALSDELVSNKEVIKRREEELEVSFNQLKTVAEDHDKLKKELLEIYKKLESTSRELKEERKIVATLNRELEVLAKQVQRDSEARRALEADLDEATRSLDEMNKSALVLSKELENTNSMVANLEAEKEMLFKALTEQKNKTKESQENIEDAQSLITRLGGERDSFEKRSKKLEEELASAKGEILRLRRQISMNKPPNKQSVNDHHQKPKEVAAGTLPVKKTATRRRKGESTL